MPSNLTTCINYLLSQGWTEQQVAIQLSIELDMVVAYSTKLKATEGNENSMVQHDITHDTELDGTTSPKPAPEVITPSISSPTPISPDSDPDTTTFASGAKRSSELKDLRYDLISPVALRRLAAAYGEGVIKYTAFNCEKGFPIFGNEGLYVHAMNHLLKFAWGDTTEDHLGHLLWNVAMMCHSQECWPELNAGTSRVDLVPAEKRMDSLDRQRLSGVTVLEEVELDSTALEQTKVFSDYVKTLAEKNRTQQPNQVVPPGSIFGVPEGQHVVLNDAGINQEAFLRPEVGVVQPYPQHADIPADFDKEVKRRSEFYKRPLPDGPANF